MDVGAMIAAMREAGIPDDRILDALSRMGDCLSAPRRSVAAERQARYRERKASQTVTNRNTVTESVTNRNTVTPKDGPSRTCSNTYLPSEDIITFPSERTGQPVPQTPQARLWSEGVPAVIALGVPEKQARSVIGRWLKASSPETVLDAIAAAGRECPVAPVPWITAALRPACRDGPSRRRPSATDAILDLIAEERAN